MHLLSSELIFQIVKYLDIKELKNLTYVNIYFKDKRLYRLYMGIIPLESFGYETIKKDIRELKEVYQYNLNDYLHDILQSFNINYTYNKYRSTKRMYYMGYSSSLKIMLNDNLNFNKSYWKHKKYENNIPSKVRLCSIYRLPNYIKKKYFKLHGNNLLALIY